MLHGFVEKGIETIPTDRIRPDEDVNPIDGSPHSRCSRVEAGKALRAMRARQTGKSRTPGQAVITFMTARPGVHPVAVTQSSGESG
jgi:hypothetical protein